MEIVPPGEGIRVWCSGGSVHRRVLSVFTVSVFGSVYYISGLVASASRAPDRRAVTPSVRARRPPARRPRCAPARDTCDGCTVPQEANIILDNAVHCLVVVAAVPVHVRLAVTGSALRALSRPTSSHSDGTVKGSDVEEGPFQTVIAKGKMKVARRQRKISNNSSNSDMEIETRQLKPTTKTDSPASPDPPQPKRRSATEKVTVGLNSLKGRSQTISATQN
ncbi:hypothetical protein EVAR_65196_1 [Eumeta japonica]|uniref:Uncharacterized protein n=1 Tax=Eumeta variegata TaxID=151549 RepID=A0A4C1ZM15_EUMVA|nr:hypothetical protein EVAR_65196_1 [Eumeta japonica]